MVGDSIKNKYSIIVCVNNDALLHQFTKTINKTSLFGYEIVPIDNINGKYSLPQALNAGITRSKGDIYFFCHQDICFPPFWLDAAIQQIELLNKKDSNWGVIGVMGVTAQGFFAGNIIDPHTSTRMGKLPCEVASLDEVCLILKKDSKLRFDESLGGFHLYGADICLQARQAHRKCYAINAPFEHLSAGKIDNSFLEIAEKLKRKWNQIEDAQDTIETTCGVFQLKATTFSHFEYLYKKIRRKIIRRLQGRHIQKRHE